MKYMVEVTLNTESGEKFEAQAGGPGPVVGRMLEEFKPEVIYMACSERTIFMVCDLDETQVATLMVVGSHIGGTYPKFMPVINGKDFGEVAGKAIKKAHTIVGK
jgi:hypothetical protein